MRLWAEERKSGTIELLLTQPITLWQAVLGKFLAAWLFTALAIAAHLPPLDHRQLSRHIRITAPSPPPTSAVCCWQAVILAIGSCMSALTRNQVIAFILSVVVGLRIHLLTGYRSSSSGSARSCRRRSRAPSRRSSFLTHFEAISKGVIDIRDLLFFGMLIGVLPGRHGHHARPPESRVTAMNLNKRTYCGGGALIALALLFIGLTILFGSVLRGWRIDLTQNGLVHDRAGHGEDPQGAERAHQSLLLL